MAFDKPRSKRSPGWATLPIVITFSSLAGAACVGKTAPTTHLAAANDDRSAGLVYATREPAQPTPSSSKAVRPTQAVDASTARDAGPAARPISDDPIVARGGVLFAKYCAICHGEEGDGQGKFAYLMNPRPRNFRQGNFKLSTTQNQVPTEGDLVRTISRGMPGSAMPSWGHLPPADLNALAMYVRHFHLEGTRAELQAWVDDGSMDPETLETRLSDRTTPGPQLVIPPEPGFDEIH